LLTAMLILVATYVMAIVVVKLRTVILLVVVAAFLALILNPGVHGLQRLGLGRGLATTVVFLLALGCFGGLAFLFGDPLLHAIAHFGSELPKLAGQAEKGQGRIGHLERKYHVSAWVKKNAPKIVSAAENLSKPALSVGAGAISLVFELFTIAMLTLLILLEAPKIRRGFLGYLRPSRAAWINEVATKVSRSVIGYMLGNVLTSLIAGVVIFFDLTILGVPFAFLQALWVGLVDLLPMIGGLLAGLPVVVIAFFHSVPDGIITLVVFLVYQQVENHILNPIVMSRTVHINPLLVLLAVLVGASLGDLVGSTFGAFVAALLAIPIAGGLQVVIQEAWRATAPGRNSALAAGEDAKTGTVP
jgi:predicted PurR-regulated permease PerM